MVESIAERRRAPRIGYVTEALVFCDGRRLFCQTADLSATGMMLLPSPSAAPCRKLTVDVNLPCMDGARVEVELVREGQHDGRYCWGVSFRKVPTYVRAVLRDYVRQRLRGVHPEQMVFGVDRARGLKERVHQGTATGSGRLRRAIDELQVTVAPSARPRNDATPARVAGRDRDTEWHPGAVREVPTKPATTRELRKAAERWGKKA